MKKFFKFTECLSRMSGTNRESLAGFLTGGKGRKGAKRLEERRLSLESLEERQLLAVTAAEYDALRDVFSDFELPQNQNNANIIEVTDLSASALQAAVNKADSSADNLIVIRTGALDASVDLGDSRIKIDNNVQNGGTLSIVALGDDGSQKKLNLITTADDAFDISDETALNLGNIQVNGVWADTNSAAVNETAEVNYMVIFSGGADSANNHRRYYDAIKDLYNTAITVYEVKPENIYILYADGTDSAEDMNIGAETTITVNSDMTFATDNGSYVYSATYANFLKVMQTVGGKMDGNDHLLLYTSDHGNGEEGKPDVTGEETIWAWGDEISGSQFANAVFNVKAGYVTVIETQCFSGGILANIIDPATGKSLNPYISASDAETKWYGMAAANHYETSISQCYVEYSAEYGAYIYTENGATGFHSGVRTQLATGQDTTTTVFAYAKANDPSAATEAYDNNGGTYTEGEEHPWGAGASFSIFTDWQPTPLAAPEIDYAISTTATSVTVTFDGVENASGYTLQYSANKDFSGSKSKNYDEAGTFVITGLNVNTTYYFRLKANGEERYSDSEWSATESVKTLAVTLPSVDNASFILYDVNDLPTVDAAGNVTSEGNYFYRSGVDFAWVCGDSSTGVKGSTFMVLQDENGQATLELAGKGWKNAQLSIENDGYAYWEKNEDGTWTWTAPEDNVVLQRTYTALVWNDVNENGIKDDGEDSGTFTLSVEWANISICVDMPTPGDKDDVVSITFDKGKPSRYDAGHGFWDNRTSNTLLTSGIFNNLGDLTCYANISEGFGSIGWGQTAMDELLSTGNFINGGTIQITTNGKTQIEIVDGLQVETTKSSGLCEWSSVDIFNTFTISSLSDYLELLEFNRRVYEFFSTPTSERSITVDTVDEYQAKYDEIQAFISANGFVPAYVQVPQTEDISGKEIKPIDEQQCMVMAMRALQAAGYTVASYPQGGEPSGDYDFEYEWTEINYEEEYGIDFTYSGTSPARVGGDLERIGGTYTLESGLGTVNFLDAVASNCDFPQPKTDGSGYSVSDMRDFSEKLNSMTAADVTEEMRAALEAYLKTLSSYSMSENVLYLDFGQDGAYKRENADGELVNITKFTLNGSELQDYTFEELRAMYTAWMNTMEYYSGMDINVTLDINKVNEFCGSLYIHTVIGGTPDDWYGAGADEKPENYIVSSEFETNETVYVFAEGEEGTVIANWINKGLQIPFGAAGESYKDQMEERESSTEYKEGIYTAAELDLTNVTAGALLSVATGQITDADQSDYYKFEVLDGDSFYFQIGGTSSNTPLKVRVNIYNVSGELIETYENPESPSLLSFRFDGEDGEPGIYYIAVMGTGDLDETGKHQDAESLGQYDIQVKKAEVLRVSTADALVEAVNTVNKMGTEEVAVIYVKAGTYTLPSTLSLKHSVTFKTQGGNVVFDGGNARQILNIAAGKTVTMDGFSLQNGYTANGGAVYVGSGACFTMSNGAISGSSATTDGGAVYNAGTMILSNITFKDNKSTQHGGAVYNAGSITMSGESLFNGNTAGGDGGAFYYTGTGAINLDGAVFTNNKASGSGGALMLSGIGTVKDGIYSLTGCTFANNSAALYGGALTLSNAKMTLTLTDVEFKLNTASNSGGAVAVLAGSVTLTDVQINENKAAVYGGGLCADGAYSVIRIIDSEINNNTLTASDQITMGGGIALNTGATLNVSGSVINSNTAMTGAGVAVIGATAVFSDTEISENVLTMSTKAAQYSGAGIYAVEGADVTLSNSSVKKHQFNAGSTGLNVLGLGIYAAGSETKLTINETSYIEHNQIRSYSSAMLAGAGIYAEECSLTIEKAYVQNNAIGVGSVNEVFTAGAGVAMKQAYAEIIDSEFYMNEIAFAHCDEGPVANAYAYGGAVYSNGLDHLTINNSRFIANRIDAYGEKSCDARGGAIFSKGGYMTGLYVVQNELIAQAGHYTADATVIALGGGICANDEIYNTVIAENRLESACFLYTNNMSAGAAVCDNRHDESNPYETGEYVYRLRLVNCTISDNYGFRRTGSSCVDYSVYSGYGYTGSTGGFFEYVAAVSTCYKNWSYTPGMDNCIVVRNNQLLRQEGTIRQFLEFTTQDIASIASLAVSIHNNIDTREGADWDEDDFYYWINNTYIRRYDDDISLPRWQMWLLNYWGAGQWSVYGSSEEQWDAGLDGKYRFSLEAFTVLDALLADEREAAEELDSDVELEEEEEEGPYSKSLREYWSNYVTLTTELYDTDGNIADYYDVSCTVSDPYKNKATFSGSAFNGSCNLYAKLKRDVTICYHGWNDQGLTGEHYLYASTVNGYGNINFYYKGDVSFFASYGGNLNNNYNSHYAISSWVLGDYHLNPDCEYAIDKAVDNTKYEIDGTEYYNYYALGTHGLDLLDASGAARLYDWENQSPYDPYNDYSDEEGNVTQSIRRKLDRGAYELQKDENIRIYDQEDYRVIEVVKDADGYKLVKRNESGEIINVTYNMMVTTLWDYVNPYDGVISLREALGYYNADGEWVDGYSCDGSTITFADRVLGGGIFFNPLSVYTPYQAATSTFTINRTIAIDAQDRKNNQAIGIYFDAVGRLNNNYESGIASTKTTDTELFDFTGSDIEITISGIDLQWKIKILPYCRDFDMDDLTSILNVNGTDYYYYYNFDYDTSFTHRLYDTNMKGIISDVTNSVITINNSAVHDWYSDGLMFDNDNRLIQSKSYYTIKAENDGTALVHTGERTTININYSSIYSAGAQNYDTIKGGAVYSVGADINITGTTIQDCYAKAMYEAYGGALYVESGNLNVKVGDGSVQSAFGLESDFRNNTATADYTQAYYTIKERLEKYSAPRGLPQYVAPYSAFIGDVPRDIRSGFDPIVNARNAVAQGGAVYIKDDSDMGYSSNLQGITFENNSVYARAKEYEIDATYTATAEGGGIYLNTGIYFNVTKPLNFIENQAVSQVDSSEFLASSELSDFAPKRNDSLALSAGGGAYISGHDVLDITVVFNDSTFEDNTVKAVSEWGTAKGYGGAVYAQNLTSFTTTRSVDSETYSLIQGNSVEAAAGYTAIGLGGGFYIETRRTAQKTEEEKVGEIVLDYAKISDNTVTVTSRESLAVAEGGGLYCEGQFLFDKDKKAEELSQKYEPSFVLYLTGNKVSADGSKNQYSTDKIGENYAGYSSLALGGGIYVAPSEELESESLWKYDQIFNWIQVKGNSADAQSTNEKGLTLLEDVYAAGGAFYLADNGADTFEFKNSYLYQNTISAKTAQTEAWQLTESDYAKEFAAAQEQAKNTVDEDCRITGAESEEDIQKVKDTVDDFLVKEKISIFNVTASGIDKFITDVNTMLKEVFNDEFKADVPTIDEVSFDYLRSDLCDLIRGLCEKVTADYYQQATAEGGGIYILELGTRNLTLTVSKSLISDSTATAEALETDDASTDTVRNANAYGGAIASTAQNLYIERGNISDNEIKSSGQAYGGALYINNENAVIEFGSADMFSYANGNKATGRDARGGAIYTNGDELNIYSNGQLNDNSVLCYDETSSIARGGAVYAENTKIAIESNNQISSNTAGTSGGAIYHVCDEDNTGKSLIVNGTETGKVTFDANAAGSYGGAIYSSGSFGLSLVYAVFGSNMAKDADGGAIYSERNDLTILASEFTGNMSGRYGAGVYCLKNGGSNINTTSFYANNAVGDGGAVYYNGTQLKVTDSTFTENKSIGDNSKGGAVHNKSTNALIIANSSFDNNSASNYGGAVYNFTTMKDGDVGLWVSNSNFVSNVTTGKNGYGGAVYNNGGSLKLVGGTAAGDYNSFSKNSASADGGALYNTRGDVTITNYNFEDNSAQGSGGAVYVHGRSSNSLYMEAMNGAGQISRNTSSGSGGAIYAETGTVTIINYDIDNNSALKDGGAIYDKSAENLTITNKRSTYGSISGNKSGADGGAIWLKTGDLTVTGYNFDNNSAGEMVGTSTTGSGGAVYAANDNSNANQQLKLTACFTGNSASENGGAVYAAADNGSTTVIVDGYLMNNTAGKNGGALYAGAKNVAVVNVRDQVSGNKATSGSGAGLYVDANEITIQQDGDLINNTAAVSGGGIYADADYETKIEVVGNIDSNTAASGSGGGIYAVTNAPNKNGKVSINVNANLEPNDDSLKLNDVVVNKNTAGQSGGGIYVQSNRIGASIYGAITSNTASTGNGGGVALDGTLIVTANLSEGDISDNKAAGDGGAIWVNVVPSVTSALTSAVLIGKENTETYMMSNNQAQTGSGGAVYCSTSSKNAEINLDIYSYDIEDNSAGKSGGAVYHTNGDFNLNYRSDAQTADPTEDGSLRYTLSNNSAKNDGGAVYHTGGDFKAFAVNAEGNEAAAGKGGVFYLDDSGESEIWLSSMRENSAASAGGVVWMGSGDSLTLNNDLLADNSVKGKGGMGAGIYSASDELTIYSSTIANNEALSNGSGGGLYLAGGDAEIRNTILAYNTAKTGTDIFVAEEANVTGDYNFAAYATKDIWGESADGMVYYDHLIDETGEITEESIEDTFPDYQIGIYMLGIDSAAVDAGEGENGKVPEYVTTYDLNGYTDGTYRIMKVTEYRVDMGAIERADSTPGKKTAVQRVQFEPQTASVDSGEDVTLKVVHKTTDTENLTSLSLRVHYNSSMLTFNADASENLAEEVIGAGKAIFQVFEDKEDFDNDANTDKYILVTWNVNDWSNKQDLMNLSFTACETESELSTTLNFTDNYHTLDYEFSSKSGTVTINKINYLDVDKNGVADLNDVSMILRYFDDPENAEFYDLVDQEDSRWVEKYDKPLTEEEIKEVNENIHNFLEKYEDVYDIDANGEFEVSVDGEILRRYFSGYTECALTWKLNFVDALRKRPDSITKYIESLKDDSTFEAPEEVTVHHKITGAITENAIVNGQNITLTVKHQLDGGAEYASSLSLKVYFNGDALTFQESLSGFLREDGEVLSKDVVKKYSIIVRDDADNEDGDVSTTKYLLVSWNSWEKDTWDAGSEEEMFQAVFTPKTGLDEETSLTFNFGYADLTANYGFESESVTVTSRTLDLDFDEDGQVNLSDTILMYRYIDGKTGDKLVKNVTKTDAATVEANLNYEDDAIKEMLDLDGDDDVTRKDVGLLERYVLGYRGTYLIDGLVDTEEMTDEEKAEAAQNVVDHIQLYWPKAEAAASGNASLSTDETAVDMAAMTETIEPQIAGVLLYTNAVLPTMAVDSSMLLSETLPVTISSRLDSESKEEGLLEQVPAQAAVLADDVFASEAENWNPVEIDAIAEETASEYEDDLLSGLLEINLD